jgi:Signal transduction histidine kinase
LDRSLNETQHLNILEIKRAGEHLLQLVGDVLDLAKIEAGRMGLSMEPVAPSRLLREVDSLLRSQADFRHIQLRLNLNGLDDVTVVADAVRLKQVLLNLVSNAVKYNRDGGKVEIDCRKTDAGLFQIAVRDTGVGISQELQQHLFQPFNRLGAEGSAIEGSGVGLVITKQLVKKMGGVLGFRSEEGYGSTFWVEFPEYTGQSIDEVANSYLRPASSISQEIPELEVSGNKRILYVEDNPPNQRLMEQLLARYPNLELTVADEPLRGIFLARTTQPDLVIMDINLPGMDGFEAVSILKQDEATSAIPVIALTANAMAQDVEKGKAFGFVYYLTKPVNLAALIDVFNELLG